MKNYPFIFLLIALSFNSCDTSILETTELPSYTIEYNKSKHVVSSENEIKELVQIIYKETNTSVENATIGTFKDDLGDFLAIKATVIDANNNKVSFFAPLNQIAAKANNSGYSVGCTMTCTSNAYCDQCKQTVYERCKRQTCSCGRQEPGSSTGQCSASIAF